MNFKHHLECAIYNLNAVDINGDIYDFPDLNTKYKSPQEKTRAFADYNILVAHSRWTSYGLNTLDPTISLMAGLMITTPSSEPGLPHLPYPTFFIRVPPGFLPFWSGDNKDIKWTEGLLVSRLKVVENNTPVFFIFTLLLGPGDGTPGNAEKTMLITTFEDEILSARDFVKEDDDFWDNKNDDILNTTNNIDINVPEKIMSRSGYVQRLTIRKTYNSTVTHRLVIRLIANLCSWLESKGGLSDQRPSNFHYGKKHNNHGWESINKKTKISQWILGREVKLSPELITSAKEHVLALASGQKGEGWHLHALGTVRGHFKRIHYGPGRCKQRRGWVEPYVRGLEDGDVVAHIYKAKERECAKKNLNPASAQKKSK